MGEINVTITANGSYNRQQFVDSINASGSLSLDARRMIKDYKDSSNVVDVYIGPVTDLNALTGRNESPGTAGTFSVTDSNGNVGIFIPEEGVAIT